jgi:polysaccharide export outer membrane protein
MTLSSKLILCVVAVGLAPLLFSQSQMADESRPAVASESTGKPKTNQLDDYIIGSDDVLAINVWKEPEISRTVPVRPDGKITLPLIGDIQAGGLTPRKLQDNLAQGLRAYVSSPEVTVIVQEVKSLKFNIVGEITRPGSYALSEPTTVLDAIAIGGGLRDFAKRGHIYVLRTNADGSHSKLSFDYKEVIKGKNLAQNVELRPGDTIVIP